MTNDKYFSILHCYRQLQIKRFSILTDDWLITAHWNNSYFRITNCLFCLEVSDKCRIWITWMTILLYVMHTEMVGYFNGFVSTPSHILKTIYGLLDVRYLHLNSIYQNFLRIHHVIITNTKELKSKRTVDLPWCWMYRLNGLGDCWSPWRKIFAGGLLRSPSCSYAVFEKKNLNILNGNGNSRLHHKRKCVCSSSSVSFFSRIPTWLHGEYQKVHCFFINSNGFQFMYEFMYFK